MNTQHLHLNLFIGGAGHHQAAWRHPDTHPEQLFDLGYYIDLAQQAEGAKFDAVFFFDRAANRHHLPTSVLGALEPFTLLSAIAVHTQRIGLIASAATAFNQPYHVVRKLAALDHISDGRAGWNIITSLLPEEKDNFGLPNNLNQQTVYEQAQEFVEVAKKLWDSWEDDAPTYDKEQGILSDINKIHTADHRGEYYSIDGPLNAPRPIQGYPVLAHSNTSGKGLDFATREAEIIFAAQSTFEDAQHFYSEVKRHAEQHGRDSRDIKILPGLSFILGETEVEARATAAELEGLVAPQYGLTQLSQLLKIDLRNYPLDSPLPSLPELDSSDYEDGRFTLIANASQSGKVTLRQLVTRLAAGRGHHHFVGTPQQLADHIEQWFIGGAADGFNLMPALLPSGLKQFTQHVVPELQRRGLFRSEYSGTTLREHYGLRRPTNQYTPFSLDEAPRPAITIL